MYIEDEIRALRASVDELRGLVQQLIEEQRKTREDARPKILDRGGIAAMLGRSRECIGAHLFRARRHGDGHGGSKLGQTLLNLARVGLDGKEAWSPADIAAHCRPWIIAAETA